jgi:hypothetical protein
MKFNKWTLGLAAVGAVSMASAVRADEAPKLSQLNTALSNTTISGVVDVGAQYNTGNVHAGTDFTPPGYVGTTDGFSLNQVIISLDKPIDETPWASGYHVDLNYGQDTVGAGYGPIRQAYVALVTPVGNGIDWKAGVFDNIIGYEGNTLSANPNYTHSYGYFVEPTTLVGLLGTYKICNEVSVSAGIANDDLGLSNVSDKTLLGAATFTAPDAWGWAKGASLTVGVNEGYAKSSQDNYYAGLTLPTPIAALKVGFAADVVSVANARSGFFSNPHNDSTWIVGAYGSFQATDKLSVNLRGEYADGGLYVPRGEELTATVQYNLWANVISRVEVRWDHLDSGAAYYEGGSFPNDNGARGDAFQLAFNVAYTF